jgi:hypothetical protein
MLMKVGDLNIQELMRFDVECGMMRFAGCLRRAYLFPRPLGSSFCTSLLVLTRGLKPDEILAKTIHGAPSPSDAAFAR